MNFFKVSFAVICFLMLNNCFAACPDLTVKCSSDAWAPLQCNPTWKIKVGSSGSIAPECKINLTNQELLDYCSQHRPGCPGIPATSVTYYKGVDWAFGWVYGSYGPINYSKDKGEVRSPKDAFDPTK